LEDSARIKLLYAVILICDIDIAGAIGRDALRPAELAVARTVAAPLGDEHTGGREFLYPMVADIYDIDVARRVHSHAASSLKLAVIAALCAPR